MKERREKKWGLLSGTNPVGWAIRLQLSRTNSKYQNRDTPQRVHQNTKIDRSGDRLDRSPDRSPLETDLWPSAKWCVCCEEIFDRVRSRVMVSRQRGALDQKDGVGFAFEKVKKQGGVGVYHTPLKHALLHNHNGGYW